MSFWNKYHQTTKLHNSYVCVGLDSDIDKLPECVRQEENPIYKFNKEIISATKNKVAAYKLNFAFYISQGKKGIKALEKTLEQIPNYIPVILDVKIGDIGNTMQQYAKAFYDEYKADAITVNMMMGCDVVDPLLVYKDKLIFVLALTSNQSASDFLKKNELYIEIAKKINKYGFKQVGAVVGATNTLELSSMRKLMPNTLFLIPGVGAQGGKVSEVVHYAKASSQEPQLLINSSRNIIFADDSAKFADTAYTETEHLRAEINQYLN